MAIPQKKNPQEPHDEVKTKGKEQKKKKRKEKKGERIYSQMLIQPFRVVGPEVKQTTGRPASRAGRRLRSRLRLRLGGHQRAVKGGREQSCERRWPLLLRRGRRCRNASSSRGGRRRWRHRCDGRGGGVGGDALAGGAHGEGGGREVHVERVHRLERAELG